MKNAPFPGAFSMARLARFELTTLAFGGQYSIQLSYKRLNNGLSYTPFYSKKQVFFIARFQKEPRRQMRRG